jgi:hypothetical protein
MRKAVQHVAAGLLIGLLVGGTARSQEIRLVYIGPSASSVLLGVEQGLAEANILGRFTGQTYAVDKISIADVTAGGSSPLAILAAAAGADLLKIASAHEGASIPVFNLTAEDDSLRQRCSKNLLHVIPSRRMRADAVAQWQKSGGSGIAEALAWHADFVKFAARELNNRFRRERGRPMDDPAWAGWAAVKMLSEGVARSQTAEPIELLAYLKEEMEFDGQKGSAHSFRDNGQLRQPLLLVVDGKLVAEAPVRGVADPEDLDTLGLASCKGAAPSSR